MIAGGPDLQLRCLTGEFVDPTREHAFRAAHAGDARRLNRIAIGIVAFAALVRIATEFYVFGPAPTFFHLLAIRLAIVALLLLVFPLTSPRRPFWVTDLGVFMLQIALAGTICAAMLIIPPALLVERVNVQSVTILLLVIGQYLFIANRVPFAATAGIATSTFYVAATLATERLAGSALGLEIFVHVIANAFGIFTVYRAAVLRRRQFAMNTAQADLNRRLETQARQLRAQAQELETARDAALQANRAKSEFLAYMSHELRSPMNAIVGFSEMMKLQVMGPISPPKYREYAEDIHGSATHLLSLINDILDLSKAEAGKLQLNVDRPVIAAAAVLYRSDDTQRRHDRVPPTDRGSRGSLGTPTADGMRVPKRRLQAGASAFKPAAGDLRAISNERGSSAYQPTR
jgi:signal transduction histidine kinase